MKYQAIDSEYIREMKEYEEFLKQKGWLMKGMKYGYFVAIIIIILSAFLSGNLVLATPNDIEYTFQNDNLYETTTPNYSDSFNVRNSSVYTGYYNATYSFEGETGLSGTNVPLTNYTEYGGTNYDIVVASENGHNEVLKMVDQEQASHSALIHHYFSSLLNIGTIDLWVNVGVSGGGRFYIQFWNTTGDRTLQLQMADDFKYDILESGGETTNQGSWTNETWTHISFDYDNTISECIIYINGVSLGTFTLINDDSVYKMGFVTRATGLTNGYIDAIGYSWGDNYSIGDNLIPYSITNTSIQEVDKWEFSYSDFPTQYAVDSDIFSDWTEVDTGDHINIAMDYNALDGMPLYFPDRQIKFHDWITSTADIGIERDFDVLNGMVNITWSYNITVIDGLSVSELTTEIYSSDDTLIYQIYLEFGNIEYKDGGDNILEGGIITSGEIYDFNFYYSPYEDIGVLRFFIDGVFYDSYFIPSLDFSKKGLGKLAFMNYYDPNRELIYYLDSVGVYSNGTSLSTEPAFRQIDLDDGLFHTNWYFVESNLLTLNLEGNIGIHLTDWYFYMDLTTIEEVLSAREFNGTDTIYNLYDHTYDSEAYIYSPRFWFEFYDQIEFTDDYLISMDGVVLDDGTTNYHLEFTSQNVETHNSYFYVSGDSLYFKMVVNENGLEYIQASFDILNVFAGNRSLSYRGQKSGTSVINSQFLTYYSDTTYNYFNLEANYKSVAVLLPSDRTIDKFDLLITDDGSDLSDSITGFLGSFTLLYVPLITTDFISISFFDALPIVVLVVVIPIALYVGFGRKKELLVPSIIAMSIFGTAVGLIPLWLTFVIGFGCVSYYIIDKRN